MPIISYSQFHEDIILAALLYDINNGHYVDVGAYHPTVDSVTEYFYQKGWRGINIEPIESLCALFEEIRPEDTNLCCGVGEKPGALHFREFKELQGHSTFSGARMNSHDNSAYLDYEVKVRTLSDILDEHKLPRIHFMKIDVEGFEFEVLKSNNWRKYRPEVLCIEANHKTEDWAEFLQERNYNKVIFDGLNEYYLSAESMSRMEDYGERAAQLMHDTVGFQHQHVWAENDSLHNMVEQQDMLIRDTQETIRQLESRLNSSGQEYPGSGLSKKQNRNKDQ